MEKSSSTLCLRYRRVLLETRSVPFIIAWAKAWGVLSLERNSLRIWVSSSKLKAHTGVSLAWASKKTKLKVSKEDALTNRSALA